jgi:hypothetical protein
MRHVSVFPAHLSVLFKIMSRCGLTAIANLVSKLTFLAIAVMTYLEFVEKAKLRVPCMQKQDSLFTIVYSLCCEATFPGRLVYMHA